ncbi:MAG: hypothetical protein LQ350_006133 [Teloschistes chrysophthalmus]|nr:MAG: hypothetical protein LQ350_006133 [Niorma chrysophthalma]
MATSNSTSNGTLETFFGGPPADVKAQAGIHQPKTYLVQDRLRVEVVPANPIKWLRRIFQIRDDELMLKCGLDGYFFIRLLRAIIIIFVPLMAVLVIVLLPINYNQGKGNRLHTTTGGRRERWGVSGLDTLSWQNIDPAKTNRYWAHLVCALLVITWSLWRMYREKVNFIDVRQRFLTSPEHRLKASARTVLITNIPAEYRSKEALEALYDVFVDNDDRSKLTVWVNRDYSSLRTLVAKRRSLRHALEKEELKILRRVNKDYRKDGEPGASESRVTHTSQDSQVPNGESTPKIKTDEQSISSAFEEDCDQAPQLWHKYSSQVSLLREKDGNWKPASIFRFWVRGERRKAPKIAWLRTEIARLTIQIDGLLLKLDDETLFKKQNSAFIQFDRQMAAHMACSLVSHNKAGRMSPRFVEVAPHEIIWPNMDVTSFGRFVRTCIALFLFAAMLFLWGIPTTILGSLSQLGSLSYSVTWLHWLQKWPDWIIGLISGPLVSILLALLIQLVVPALARKLAVLVGSPTRSKREVSTQNFYFTFLFIELVLLTALSSGVVKIVPQIINNPINIPTILATSIPTSANYFFNYLVVQSLGFSGSVLFQYLRVLYITTIWPWFTQTPREEAWLQTTIPHQVSSSRKTFAAFEADVGADVGECLFTLYEFCSNRNKVDTHGLLFNNAISQLFAGIYVLEIALIGLFLLVRDLQNNVACKSQAIIMIVVLILTAVFHFVVERHLQPLYEFLPVTLEDSAVDAERRAFLIHDDDQPSPEEEECRSSNDVREKALERPDRGLTGRPKSVSVTADQARSALTKLRKETAIRVANIQAHLPESTHKSRRREVADQLGAAIAGFPDELTDLTPEEREAQLRAAFQDPVTREPPPVIWIPQDVSGISEDAIRQSKKYGRYLQYSNAGAFLTARNKCEITQPAPDTRPDWLLDWVL